MRDSASAKNPVSRPVAGDGGARVCTVDNSSRGIRHNQVLVADMEARVMKYWRSKRAALPYHVRVEIVERVNAGEDRQGVGTDLGVGLVAVDRAVAWGQHVAARSNAAAHRTASRELRERMGERQ